MRSKYLLENLMIFLSGEWRTVQFKKQARSSGRQYSSMEKIKPKK